MDYTSANNHHQSNQNDNLATKRQGSTNSGKTGGKSQYYNGAIMMTTMPINESQMAELDRLGAHFKFLDLTQRLNKVIQESRQERRSQELLLYQAHFSKNDPTEVEQQSPTILRRDFIRKEQPSVAQQNAGGTSGFSAQGQLQALSN